MKKKIAIARVEPVILEFEDGSQKMLMLNNSALVILTEEFGTLEDIIEESKSKPIEFLARLIYAGIKTSDLDFTYEEAEVIAINGGAYLLMELTEHLSQVLGGYSKDETLKKKVMDKIQGQLKKI